MQVVLVAGGKNERFKELSIFPKVLLPYLSDGKSTTILKYYADNIDDLIVIINKKYTNQVKSYLESNNIRNVTVIESTVQNGSFSTIHEIINELPNDELLFIWSDLILPKDFITYITHNLHNNNYIFTKLGKYRLQVKDNHIEDAKDGLGNIPGVYMIKDKSILNTKNNYLDLAFLYNDIEFNSIEIDGEITEFIDQEHYRLFVRDQRIKTRSFNEIIFNENTVTKIANNEYSHLIKNETNWYKNSAKYLDKNNFIPNLINSTDNSITLSKLDKNFKPLFEYKDFSKNTLNNLINFISEFIHASKPIDISCAEYDTDVDLEIIQKTISRVNKIYGMLYRPLDQNDLMNLLTKAKEVINSKFSREYHFLHGDLNFSNILYDGKDFALLDPRGYFGNTKLFGPDWYEYGKIYYGLSGYDDFNQSFNYFYSLNGYDKPKPILSDTFDSILPEYKILVGIIYINLTSYISDNIMKVNIAYDYGLKLLKQGLSELSD